MVKARDDRMENRGEGKMKVKLTIAGVFIVVLMVIAPFTVAAVTNTEAIAMFTEQATQLRLLGQDAYCAVGITAFCP